MSGREAVVLARRAVDAEATGSEPPAVPEGFGDRAGAFVTLSRFPSGDLRGCIGFPMPVMPLGKAIVEAAREACHDPRFPDLRASELSLVTVEVTVLTVPEPLLHDGSEDLVSKVVVGRDGLIISLMGYRGLLLPQVPVEWGWDSRTYLEHLSMKAGLPPDAWTHPDARIERFEGEAWAERTPYGEISAREDHGHRDGIRGTRLRRRRAPPHRDRGDGR